MNDSISRQAAIDALCKSGCGSGYCGISCDDVKAIEQLPSAQSERWIPVTERLPERTGYYLVTGRQGAVNKRLYQDGYWYGNWTVIAWMPLPEPYRGNRNDSSIQN